MEKIASCDLFDSICTGSHGATDPDHEKGTLRRKLVEHIQRLAGRESISAVGLPVESDGGGEHRRQFDVDLGIGAER